MFVDQKVKGKRRLLSSLTPVKTDLDVEGSMERVGDVDICVTCVSDEPPQLPLREELNSLGVEVIYNAQGLGARAVQKETKKALKLFQKQERKKEKKKRKRKWIRLFPKSQRVILQMEKAKKLIENELRRCKGLSYDTYTQYLGRIDDLDSSSSTSSCGSNKRTRRSAKATLLKTRRKSRKKIPDTLMTNQVAAVDARENDSDPHSHSVYQQALSSASEGEREPHASTEHRQSEDIETESLTVLSIAETLRISNIQSESRAAPAEFLAKYPSSPTEQPRTSRLPSSQSALNPAAEEVPATPVSPTRFSFYDADVNYETAGASRVHVPAATGVSSVGASTPAAMAGAAAALVAATLHASRTSSAPSSQSDLNSAAEDRNPVKPTSPTRFSFYDADVYKKDKVGEQTVAETKAGECAETCETVEQTAPAETAEDSEWDNETAGVSREAMAFETKASSEGAKGAAVAASPGAMAGATAAFGASTVHAVRTSSESSSQSALNAALEDVPAAPVSPTSPRSFSFDDDDAYNTKEKGKTGEQVAGDEKDEEVSDPCEAMEPTVPVETTEKSTRHNNAFSKTKSEERGKKSMGALRETTDAATGVTSGGATAAAVVGTTAAVLGTAAALAAVRTSREPSSQSALNTAAEDVCGTPDSTTSQTRFSFYDADVYKTKEEVKVGSFSEEWTAHESEKVSTSLAERRGSCSNEARETNQEQLSEKNASVAGRAVDTSDHPPKLASLDSNPVCFGTLSDDAESENSAVDTSRQAMIPDNTSFSESSVFDGVSQPSSFDDPIQDRSRGQIPQDEDRRNNDWVASGAKSFPLTMGDEESSLKEFTSRNCHSDIVQSAQAVGLAEKEASSELSNAVPLELQERPRALLPQGSMQGSNELSDDDDHDAEPGLNHFSHDFVQRSDKLFGFNPSILPFRREPNRIGKIEAMIRDEARRISSESDDGEMSLAMRLVWIWLCTYDDSTDEQDTYVESVKRIVGPLESDTVERLAMTKTEDGAVLLDIAVPECVNVIKAGMGQGAKLNRTISTSSESQSTVSSGEPRSISGFDDSIADELTVVGDGHDEVRKLLLRAALDGLPVGVKNPRDIKYHSRTASWDPASEPQTDWSKSVERWNGFENKSNVSLASYLEVHASNSDANGLAPLMKKLPSLETFSDGWNTSCTIDETMESKSFPSYLESSHLENSPGSLNNCSAIDGQDTGEMVSNNQCHSPLKTSESLDEVLPLERHTTEHVDQVEILTDQVQSVKPEEDLGSAREPITHSCSPTDELSQHDVNTMESTESNSSDEGLDTTKKLMMRLSRLEENLLSREIEVQSLKFDVNTFENKSAIQEYASDGTT